MAPVTSSTVEVTKAGRPAAADQASSSIFATNAGMIADNSRCASSGGISWMSNERQIALPTVDSCSNCVSDCGPVRTYSAPVCPSSHNTRAATAAMSRSSIGAVGTLRQGQRTTSPAQICFAHQSNELLASIPGRRKTQSSPESSIIFSICSVCVLLGLGCWKKGCGVFSGAERNTRRRMRFRSCSKAGPKAPSGAVQTRNAASTSNRHPWRLSGEVKSPCTTSTSGGKWTSSNLRVRARTG